MMKPLTQCPECGGRLKKAESNGTVIQECTSCDYAINLTTGEVQHIHLDKYVLICCPKCDGRIYTNADYMTNKQPEVTCPYCDTKFTPPDTVDQTLKTIEACPHCGKENNIPANRGNLNVTCGHCGKKFPFYSGETELIYEKQDVCPECGGSLVNIKRNGVTIKECESCSYACNTATGEVYHVELDEKYIVAPCPKCGLPIMANADIRGVKEPKIGCPICDVIFDYPAAPDGNLKTTEICPHCGGENRLPANRGKLRAVCTHCTEAFEIYTGEKAILRDPVKQKPVIESKPASYAAVPKDLEEDIRILNKEISGILNSGLMKMICAQQAQVLGDDGFRSSLRDDGGAVFAKIVVGSKGFHWVFTDQYGNEVFTGTESLFSQYYEWAKGKDAATWGERLAQDNPPIHRIESTLSMASVAGHISGYVARVTGKYIYDEKNVRLRFM